MDLDDEELEATREIFFCKEENSTGKIKTGEYVRTTDGKIGKFAYTTSARPNDRGFYYINHGRNEIEGYWDNEIKKHSKNIIDLIEVGDLVKYNDRVLVVDDIYRTKDYASDKSGKLCVYSWNIKSILTHEQYEKYCYDFKKEKK